MECGPQRKSFSQDQAFGWGSIPSLPWGKFLLAKNSLFIPGRRNVWPLHWCTRAPGTGTEPLRAIDISILAELLSQKKCYNEVNSHSCPWIIEPAFSLALAKLLSIKSLPLLSVNTGAALPIHLQIISFPPPTDSMTPMWDLNPSGADMDSGFVLNSVTWNMCT